MHNMAMGGDPTRVLGRRVIGAFFEALIDALVLYTLLAGVGIRAGRGFGTVTPATFGDTNKIALVYLVYLAYVVVTKVFTLGMYGWTPGMLMMSLRCVRYDGRPAGIPRALLRTLFYTVYAQFGCLFYLTVWFPMYYTKTHKGFQDMLVGTYVIDAMYAGHLLMPEPGGGVIVGPPSVTREEAAAYVQTQTAGTFVPPVSASAMNGDPFLDKNLDTYVVWNARQSSWLAFDKTTGTWTRIA
jgi:uncharacterized RDD family membrane protein YckC